MSRPKGSKNVEKDVSTNVENGELVADNKYIVIKSGDFDIFLFCVNKSIGDGYTCQGGVSGVTWQGINGREFLYSQAMIRKE